MRIARELWRDSRLLAERERMNMDRRAGDITIRQFTPDLNDMTPSSRPRLGESRRKISCARRGLDRGRR